MRAKNLLALLVSSLVLLTGLLFSVHAQESDTVYLPLISGSGAATSVATPPTATPSSTPTPTNTPGEKCLPTGGSGGLQPGTHFNANVAGLRAHVIVGQGYEPTVPTRLVFYLHGSGGNAEDATWFTNYGSDIIHDEGWIFIAPISPKEDPSWVNHTDQAPDERETFKQVLDQMFLDYNICRNALIGIATSGGAVFFGWHFFPYLGDQYPVHMLLGCGAGASYAYPDLVSKIEAFGQMPYVVANTSFQFTYTEGDFLGDGIVQSMALFRSAGFRVIDDKQSGFGHCAFDSKQTTRDFLDRMGRELQPTPQPGADTAEEVFIATGTFLMGCDTTNPAENGCNVYSWQTRELPLHTVYLDAYYIDKHPVTNARYKACVGAGGCTQPQRRSSWTRDFYHSNPTYADYPVINVGWHQADAFCSWAGKRLPTEAEWEKAARGSSDIRKYPWGNEEPTCSISNYWEQSGACVGDTSRVGSYPAGASPYGVMDMAGNVREWVNDWYQSDYYSVSPGSNPQGPTTGERRVLRGGDLSSSNDDLRSAHRNWFPPDFGHDSLGFRCVRLDTPTPTPTATPTGTSTVSSKVRYVTTSGSDTDNDCVDNTDACLTVQHAINVADPDDEIRIAAGTYNNVNDLGGKSQIALINKTLTLRGGYHTSDWNIYNPMINRSILKAPNVVQVLNITGTISVTIQGLQISGTDMGSTGVYANGSTLTLLDNVIEGHKRGSSGSGIGLFLHNVNGVFRNNTIRNNYAEFAGAGAYIVSSEVVFISNIFEDHYLFSPFARGGGLYLGNSIATLIGNVFRRNEAGDGGAIYVNGGRATLINNAIIDNTLTPSSFRAREGSGIKSFGSELYLLHNTIARNTGGDGSGIAIVTDNWNGIASQVWMTNTILVSQTVGITATAGNTVTVNGILWSDNEADTGGAGSISIQNSVTGNAAFAADGYHLLAASDAIDQGVEAGVATDIDGEPRSDIPDLGADEYINPSAVEKLFIPTGTFHMGCDVSQPAKSCLSDEQSLHTNAINAYYFEEYRVINTRYKACLNGGGCTLPQQVNSWTHTPTTATLPMPLARSSP